MFSVGGLLNTAGNFMGLGPNEGEKPTYNKQYQLPHYGEQYGQYGQMAGQFGGRAAPQSQYGGGASGGNFVGAQRAFGGQLYNEAQGRGVGQGVVRMQAQNMANRTQAQQYGMAASQRPGMGALGYQNAAMNAANSQAQVGGQAALAGGQMQLGAMNQYGQFLQGARGQDQQLNMFNQSQHQQNNQYNSDAQLRQMGLNDQSQLEALRQRLAASQMQQQGGLAYNQNMAQYNAARMAQPTAGQNMLGMAGGLAGGYFGMAGSQQQQPQGGGQAPTGGVYGSSVTYNPNGYGMYGSGSGTYNPYG